MNYRLDTVLLMTWLMILAIGTVMVASASIVKGDGFLYRHMLFLTLALTGFLIGLITPLKVWEQGSRMALIASLLVCTLVLIVGVERNGAHRWIAIGGFTEQINIAVEANPANRILQQAAVQAHARADHHPTESARVKMIRVTDDIDVGKLCLQLLQERRPAAGVQHQ